VDQLWYVCNKLEKFDMKFTHRRLNDAELLEIVRGFGYDE